MFKWTEHIIDVRFSTINPWKASKDGYNLKYLTTGYERTIKYNSSG